MVRTGRVADLLEGAAYLGVTILNHGEDERGVQIVVRHKCSFAHIVRAYIASCAWSGVQLQAWLSATLYVLFRCAFPSRFINFPAECRPTTIYFYLLD